VFASSPGVSDESDLIGSLLLLQVTGKLNSGIFMKTNERQTAARWMKSNDPSG